jgi:Tat protein translocase TatB subunit
MPGPLELLIIAALALIVFGPARLPEIARSIGKAVNEFRRQASDLKAEFDFELDQEDERPGRSRINEPAAKDRPEEKPSQDPDPSTEPEGPEGPDPKAPEGEPRPDKS